MSWLKRNPIAMIIKRGSEAIDSLIEAVETLLGQRGDPLDRVVTFRDLYTAGVTGLKDTSGQVRYWNGPVSVPLVPVAGTGAADLSSYPAVSAPPSLTVDSTLSANILSWDTPDTPRYAYTKVFRADTDNYASATEIGASGGGFYYDLIGSGGITKYYWIRHTDIDGLDTALNDTDGTLGTTGYLTDPDIADGTIHGGKIQTGTLAADRIAAGTMTAGITYTGTLVVSSTGDIQSSNYSAGVAGYKFSASGIEMNSGSFSINSKFVVDSSGNVTIQSGTSGARLQVYNNVIKVYDSGGTLRVKLGDLSA